MATRIASYGHVENLSAGTLVFERGQRSVDFFFVLAGRIEIFDLDEHGEPNVFTVHGERQLTGELDLFNDRMILVSGRAGVDSKVVRVQRANFRRLVTGEPDIGEILDARLYPSPHRLHLARAGWGSVDRPGAWR